MGCKPFWNNFGTGALKTDSLEHRPGTPSGFCAFFGAVCLRYTPRPLPCTDAATISVPEGMGRNMGQVVTAGEIIEPAGDTVRVYAAARVNILYFGRTASE